MWWNHHVVKFPPVDSIQKIIVVKNFDRKKNPQDVQGLTFYLGIVPGLWFRMPVRLRIVPFRFQLYWVTMSQTPPGPVQRSLWIQRCWPRKPFGSNLQGKKGSRYVETAVFPVGGVECSMYPKIFLQPEPCKVLEKLPEVLNFSGSARNSLLTPIFCLQPSTIFRVFDVLAGSWGLAGSQSTSRLFVLSLFLRLRVKNWNWNWISQPIAFGLSFLQSRISIDNLIL